jgi:hypothetical protein
LVGSGIGLRVQATLSDTGALELATGPDTPARNELVLAFTKEEPRHLVGVPEADLVLLLTMPDSNEPEAQPRVQVFEEGSGEFILEQDAPDDTTLIINDVSFSLMPIPYTLVQVVHDRGAFWSQLGAVLFLAGVLLRGLVPLLRARIRQQTDSSLALRNRGRHPSQNNTASGASKPNDGGV